MGLNLPLAPFVICCLALPAFAQLDSSALRTKYGSPLNRETFSMPAGFELTVDYGVANQVCKITVPSLMPTKETVSNELDLKQRMYQFLGELVPPSMRGKELRRGVMAAGAISMSFVEYEQVFVNEVQHADRPFGNDPITVTFKNENCPKPAGQ